MYLGLKGLGALGLGVYLGFRVAFPDQRSIGCIGNARPTAPRRRKLSPSRRKRREERRPALRWDFPKSGGGTLSWGPYETGGEDRQKPASPQTLNQAPKP